MDISFTLGRRVELVSMDPYQAGISLGLYVRDGERGPIGTVDSYSSLPGTGERLSQVAQTIREMAGLVRGGDDTEVLFSCGVWHAVAAKRVFLEATKRGPRTPLAPPALEVRDTRSEQTIPVAARGSGSYGIQARGVVEGEASRAPAIARAIAKLAELELSDDGTTVSFPCGQPHDDLIALLLNRAQNLRAILREEALQADRGVLAVPSGRE